MMADVVRIHPKAHVQARREEQTGAIGMMVALGSWGMMFAALFFMYLGLRARTLAWPPPGLPPLPLTLPLINTVVIALSSVALVRALRHMRAADRRQSALWMSGTFALGMLFVALQCVLWWSTWQQGITTSTGVLGTVMYSLTFLHALHVVAGLLVLGYLLVITLRGKPLAGRVTTLRNCGMFWHFVGVIWGVMFVGMFLL